MGVYVCMDVCVIYYLISILQAPVGCIVGRGRSGSWEAGRKPARDGGKSN